MGHSQADKADSHERIVVAAARCFREHGVDGISVADVMLQAGLTPGGFFRHFDSRDDLVAAAVERALADGGAAVTAVTSRPGAGLAALVDAYLSLVHRDHIAASCAVTTLAGDVARSGARARQAYARQVDHYAQLIAGLIATTLTKKQRRTQALAALATLVGAVSMARAVDDDALSREILKSAAAALKSRLA